MTGDEDVISCGRCGRENRGTSGGRIDNGRYLPDSREEAGWILLLPTPALPLVPDGVALSASGQPSLYVCPGCLVDEERPPADGTCRTVACGRCGRENRGRLRYEQVVEWEETDWLVLDPAWALDLDGAPVCEYRTVGPATKYVCSGCQTAEERAQLEAVEWRAVGREEPPAA